MATRHGTMLFTLAPAGRDNIRGTARRRPSLLRAFFLSPAVIPPADLVRRCSAIARRMAGRLADEAGVAVLNEVVLNQVLARFGDDDALTRDVVRRVQEDGTCWLGGSTWRGKAVMRISVSNWATTEADGDLSVEAILRSYREARGRA